MAQTRSVVVTGGAGFMGKALFPALTKRGWEVLAVDSQAPGTSGDTFEQCDITEPAPLEAIFQAKQFDAIIHLASILPTATKADPHTATNVNIGGSLNILEAAKTIWGPPRYLREFIERVWHPSRLAIRFRRSGPCSRRLVWRGQALC